MAPGLFESLSRSLYLSSRALASVPGQDLHMHIMNHCGGKRCRRPVTEYNSNFGAIVDG
jgi:hypothetical protein